MSPRPAAARTPRPRRAQRGALLIEGLVAILICAFGLLGFAGMQARATASEFESYQRSQALVLIEDMVSRINTNRANAADYVSDELIGEGEPVVCDGTGADLDLCEWGNLIRGSAETRDGSAVGAMISARGRITLATNTTDRYVVCIVWQGTVSSGAPASDCGQDDASFPDESLRRVVSSTVCIARLRDPAVTPATPRC
jgi:type IV pilus assembly protein PilV